MVDLTQQSVAAQGPLHVSSVSVCEFANQRTVAARSCDVGRAGIVRLVVDRGAHLPAAVSAAARGHRTAPNGGAAQVPGGWPESLKWSIALRPPCDTIPRMVLERTLALICRYTGPSWLLSLICLAPALAAALQCSEIEFQGTRSSVCRVDLRADRLQLFLKDDTGKPFNTFQRVAQSLAAHDEQLAFAMNAGMFREDYTPVGLLVIAGRQVHRLNLATGFGNFYLKPNGVFVLSAAGARIVESSEYRSLEQPAILATQSGPLLLHAGQVNPNLSPQGTSRLIRNGVGVVSPNEIVFVISEEPINFYEFAVLFRDHLKCADALYFDGNVSSLYSQGLGRNDERVPLGPIIGVTTSIPKSRNTSSR
jgi:uncharacterized protein YigE (DUF2233 family)